MVRSYFLHWDINMNPSYTCLDECTTHLSVLYVHISNYINNTAILWTLSHLLINYPPNMVCDLFNVCALFYVYNTIYLVGINWLLLSIWLTVTQLTKKKQCFYLFTLFSFFDFSMQWLFLHYCQSICCDFMPLNINILAWELDECASSCFISFGNCLAPLSFRLILLVQLSGRASHKFRHLHK